MSKDALSSLLRCFHCFRSLQIWVPLRFNHDLILDFIAFKHHFDDFMRRRHFWLETMVSCPLDVAKRPFSVIDYVVFFSEAIDSFFFQNELHNPIRKVKDKLLPVNLSQIEIKLLFVLWRKSLVKPLRLIAIIDPLIPNEKPERFDDYSCLFLYHFKQLCRFLHLRVSNKRGCFLESLDWKGFFDEEEGLKNSLALVHFELLGSDLSLHFIVVSDDVEVPSDHLPSDRIDAT